MKYVVDKMLENAVIIFFFFQSDVMLNKKLLLYIIWNFIFEMTLIKELKKKTCILLIYPNTDLKQKNCCM